MCVSDDLIDEKKRAKKKELKLISYAFDVLQRQTSFGPEVRRKLERREEWMDEGKTFSLPPSGLILRRMCETRVAADAYI